MSQTTCPECGDPLDETHGLLSSPNSRYCPEPRGTGTVPSEAKIKIGDQTWYKDGHQPSEPTDSLEQEVRELLDGVWHSRAVYQVVPDLLALIRRREISSVEAFAERVKAYATKITSGDEPVRAFPDGVLTPSDIDAELAKLKEGDGE